MSEASAKEARRLLLSGRVQGVSFRWFTRREADALGLVGWVRNLSDGGVEVQAAGLPAQLDRFEERLREGPAGARVDRLDREPLAAAATWTDFQIKF